MALVLPKTVLVLLQAVLVLLQEVGLQGFKEVVLGRSAVVVLVAWEVFLIALTTVADRQPNPRFALDCGRQSRSPQDLH